MSVRRITLACDTCTGRLVTIGADVPFIDDARVFAGVHGWSYRLVEHAGEVVLVDSCPQCSRCPELGDDILAEQCVLGRGHVGPHSLVGAA